MSTDPARQEAIARARALAEARARGLSEPPDIQPVPPVAASSSPAPASSPAQSSTRPVGAAEAPRAPSTLWPVDLSDDADELEQTEIADALSLYPVREADKAGAEAPAVRPPAADETETVPAASREEVLDGLFEPTNSAAGLARGAPETGAPPPDIAAAPAIASAQPGAEGIRNEPQPASETPMPVLPPPEPPRAPDADHEYPVPVLPPPPLPAEPDPERAEYSELVPPGPPSTAVAAVDVSERSAEGLASPASSKEASRTVPLTIDSREPATSAVSRQVSLLETLLERVHTRARSRLTAVGVPAVVGQGKDGF